jgi:hypothetical protein
MSEVTEGNDKAPQPFSELDPTSPEKIAQWVDSNVNYPQRGIAHEGRPDGTWPEFDEQVAETRKVVTTSLNEFLTLKMPPEMIKLLASQLVGELRTSYFSEKPDLNNLEPWLVRHFTTPDVSFAHKTTLKEQLEATRQQEKNQVKKDVAEGILTVEEIQNDLMRAAHGDDALIDITLSTKEHKPSHWRPHIPAFEELNLENEEETNRWINIYVKYPMKGVFDTKHPDGSPLSYSECIEKTREQYRKIADGWRKSFPNIEDAKGKFLDAVKKLNDKYEKPIPPTATST